MTPCRDYLFSEVHICTCRNVQSWYSVLIKIGSKYVTKDSLKITDMTYVLIRSLYKMYKGMSARNSQIILRLEQLQLLHFTPSTSKIENVVCCSPIAPKLALIYPPFADVKNTKSRLLRFSILPFPSCHHNTSLWPLYTNYIHFTS